MARGRHVCAQLILGRLITRFGAEKITGIGLVIIALAAVFGYTGTTIFHFMAALILLGWAGISASPAARPWC